MSTLLDLLAAMVCVEWEMGGCWVLRGGGGGEVLESVWTFEEEKNLLSQPGIEPRFVQPIA